MDEPTVTEKDIELIHQSRSRNKYKDFSDAERDAHAHVHEVLRQLGTIAVEELGGTRDYSLKLTSGFHPKSGVRGAKPKDLWFGVYRKENEEPFLANPQIFMIVSQRGVEWGFSPLTHPDDFSNQDIKRRTRKIARDVLEQLPVPGSPEAKKLAVQLAEAGDWYFRRKQRLEPKQSERPSLDDWLSYERSEDGVRNAGGGITRYALPQDVSKINFSDEVRQSARLFKPLMEKIVANAPPATASDDVDLSRHRDLSLPAFDDLLRAFLREFAIARKGPFQKSNQLWNAMADVKTRLEMFPAVRNRSDLLVSISVGQGNWASVPWIALLNTSVTRSTQEGIYIVFLISHDLGRIFLTLNQGTTNLVRELGQREAQKRMLDVANKTHVLFRSSRHRVSL
jgi:MrcB-like, N-terminal domain